MITILRAFQLSCYILQHFAANLCSFLRIVFDTLVCDLKVGVYNIHISMYNCMYKLCTMFMLYEEVNMRPTTR